MKMTIDDLGKSPRPQLVREKWQDLNGIWDFCYDDSERGERSDWYRKFPSEEDDDAEVLKIRVPFAPETQMSGIGDTALHEYCWYHLELPVSKSELEEGAGSRYLIHFEGVDHKATVWINGSFAGEHVGGYTRWTVDATPFLAEINEVVLKVEDSDDLSQPRGKQRWKDSSFGCWYEQTTGIWKSVWAEFVPKNYIDEIFAETDPVSGEISLDITLKGDNIPRNSSEELAELDRYLFEDAVIEGDSGIRTEEEHYAGFHLKVEVTAPDGQVHAFVFGAASEKVSEKITIPEFDPVTCGWTPEKPELFEMKISLYRGGDEIDTVYSYFAFRIECRNYLRMVLDQGYWRESGLTPPDADALLKDVEAILAFGFNGVRVHQKIEDERFFYWCDRLGVMAFCEMPSMYRFDEESIQRFLPEWSEVVRQHRMHPCVTAWVPVNESWGVPEVLKDPEQQDFLRSIYYETKALDPARPVISNDGWEHVLSDIVTIHDYEGDADILGARYREIVADLSSGDAEKCRKNGVREVFAHGVKYRGEPVMLSEFGGIALSGSDGWGYGKKAGTKEEMCERISAMFRAVHSCGELCGYCYTQLTDVQQEKNGLMDEEHRPKIEPEVVRGWMGLE